MGSLTSSARWADILVIGVWGGLMALERRAFLQAMVSRPLVAGTVSGLLLGDVMAGLFVGLVFEVFHLSGVSLGGAHPDHDTLPAVAAAALAAGMGSAASGEATPAMWSLAIVVCAPFGRAGLLLENWLDRRARKYFGRALTAADAGNMRRVARQNLRAMWPQFVFYGLICGAATAAGPGLEHLLDALPVFMLRGLAWAYPAMAAVAVAVAIQGSHTPRRFVIGVVAAISTGAFLWLRS